jgi:peptide-methionine (S)-S-oxide reductase
MTASRFSRSLWVYAGIAGLAVMGAALRMPARADGAKMVPAPVYDPADSQPSETATLSGGCFWGMQGVFEHVKGVRRVYAGYTGGGAATAQYEIVSTGATGHAESVQIVFDPAVISYGKILQIYFSVAADPTQLNYQGPDSGTQYRSEIWYASPAQHQIAAAYIAELTKAHSFASPIVVRLDPAMPFYQAESYHQDFLVLHPDYPYIAVNDVPKVESLRMMFPKLYENTPITVFPVHG